MNTDLEGGLDDIFAELEAKQSKCFCLQREMDAGTGTAKSQAGKKSSGK